MVIFFVGFEMVGQVRNSLGQKRNLDFWGARIGLVCTIITYDFLFFLRMQRHHFILFNPR